jgi:hypothetical protein
MSCPSGIPRHVLAAFAWGFVAAATLIAGAPSVVSGAAALFGFAVFDGAPPTGS